MIDTEVARRADTTTWKNKISIYMAAEAQRLDDDDPMRVAYNALNDQETNLASLEAELRQLRSQYNDARDEEDDADDSAAKYDHLKDQLSLVNQQITDAKAVEKEAQDKVDALQQQYDDLQAAEEEVRTAQRSLEDLTFALAEQQKADGKTQALEQLDIQQMSKQIEQQHELVEELSGQTVETNVTSPVSGTVKSVNITAGQNTELNTALISIEVADRGYTLTFAVTNEQAQRVRIGDPGTVSGSYWGSDLTASLSAIKPDPDNPGKGKLLVFDVGGSVETGQQLTVSIGERSSNYETIVPNSAVRSDANGKFVLVVQSKSSPLGNRYVATRVDVQVLASDDLNSAVSGGLSASDFVITTSSHPIEPGMLVRLPEA